MLVTYIENQPPAELLKSLQDKILVVYAGTLEHYQGIDIVISAFPQVIQAIPHTHLLIVGGTKEQVDHYSSLADRYGIGLHCTFTGRVPQSLAQYYSNHAQVQISSRVSGTNTPLKVYEQIARGIPLVATNIYSHTQVLSEEVAFLVKPEAPSMAQGIIAALAVDGDGQRRATNAQQLYEQRYSRQVYTRKMKQLLDYIAS